MKAIQINEGKMFWEETSLPTYGDSEVLIKIKATDQTEADINTHK